MNFHNVVFETSFGRFDQLPKSDLVEIAFAGRSNVGKSSMINKVFNRKQLARVSAVPGKTATINFFRLESVRFVDLPGYGYAKVAKGEKERWAKLIDGYFRSGRNIGLVFQLVDIRHKPSQDDLQMIDFLIENEFPFDQDTAGRASGSTPDRDSLCGSDYHDPVLVRKGRWGRGSQGNH